MSDATINGLIRQAKEQGIAVEKSGVWYKIRPTDEQEDMISARGQEQAAEEIERLLEEVEAEVKEPGPCLCGCGALNETPRANFLRGHDAKLRSKLMKVARGEIGAEAIPDVFAAYDDAEATVGSLLAPYADNIDDEEFDRVLRALSARQEEVAA